MKVNISKGDEQVDAEEVFKKIPVKFSRASHLILPIRLLGREVIVVVPKDQHGKVFSLPAKQRKDGTWKIKGARK